jgi:hypothetical protein
MPASAVGNYIQDKGYNAAVALTKFRAVKFSAAETVTPVTAATDVVAGIVQHDVTAAEILKGKGASIRVEGDSVMEASAAIAVGQLVSCTATGTAKVAAATERIIGVCRHASGAAGDYITVKLNLPGSILA